MKRNEEGNSLTIEILKHKGFVKEIILDNDGDEIKWWIKDGVSIHEDSWWLNDTKGTSFYAAHETSPEITFSFAVYIKSDGRFKSGYRIETDTQLDNLYYSLTNRELD